VREPAEALPHRRPSIDPDVATRNPGGHVSVRPSSIRPNTAKTPHRRHPRLGAGVFPDPRRGSPRTGRSGKGPNVESPLHRHDRECIEPLIEADARHPEIYPIMQPIHIRCGNLSVRHRCLHHSDIGHPPLQSGGSGGAKSQLHRVDHHRGRSRRRGRQPGAAALRHGSHATHDKH